MSDLNLGTKAATRQSWARDSIRVYVKQLQDENPRANEGRLVALLAQRMRDDDEALMAAAEYAVRNAINTQQGYSRPDVASRPTPTPAERALRSAKVEEAATVAANQILLLNQEMPNGQRMRHCTGTYISKLGGQYARAGKKAGHKLMGQVFDEQSLRQYIDAV